LDARLPCLTELARDQAPCERKMAKKKKKGSETDWKNGQAVDWGGGKGANLSFPRTPLRSLHSPLFFRLSLNC